MVSTSWPRLPPLLPASAHSFRPPQLVLIQQRKTAAQKLVAACPVSQPASDTVLLSFLHHLAPSML